MKLLVYNDNGTINTHEIKKELFYDASLQTHTSFISTPSKEQNALNILKSYFSNSKSILTDNSNRVLIDELVRLNVAEFGSEHKSKTIFDRYDFTLAYYTSGSTGFPKAALKTLDNILSELEDLDLLLDRYKPKKIIVTVPFIHFYGSLFGLFYPLYKGIDIALKEHFLPNDLLDLIDNNSLIVTTPLYIKALNSISSSKDLSRSIFISSTAPLQAEDAKIFNKKFKTDIIQIFGSTESGGIAYKYNDDELLTPLASVKIEVDSSNLLSVYSPYVSNYIYENNLFKATDGRLETFDYVELHKHKFKLVGRSSQILKLAGKRYSTLQIEQILEGIDEIQKALVFVKHSDSLRSEILKVTIQSDKIFSKKEIQNILKKHLSNLKFELDLKIVKEIKTSSSGKKLAIQ